MRIALIIFFLLGAVACAGAQTEGPEMNLSNARLTVRMSAAAPVVLGYEHTATGVNMAGADTSGTLVINGQAIPWDRFRIRTRQESNRIVYELALPEQGIRFDYVFTLRAEMLTVELRNFRDPQQRLQTIAWNRLPLLTCAESTFSFWRLSAAQSDWAHREARGLWGLNEAGGHVGQAAEEASPVLCLYGCLYRPDKLCVFVHTNYPLLPLTCQILADGRCAVGLNTYHYRVRAKTMPPLRAEVVFLTDVNGDGKADLSDYRLWINRRLPDPDPRYKTSLWFKIFCASPATGVTTTFAEAGKIIAQIAHVTDGLPQIAYLVGWQYDGHDTGYPSLDKVNPKLGGLDALRALSRRAKARFHANVSFHANIDDAYTDSKDFDPALMARDADGSPMWWFDYHGRTCYHLSHTRDVESGAIFRRLEAMQRLLPWEHTVQLDAMRTTNCNPAWEPDGIGVLEELECGLKPILEWLRARGISVTTEGQNGVPHEFAGLVSGFWHLDLPDDTIQIHHGKLIGGGRGSGTSRRDCGLGTSIHQDLSYRPIPWGQCVQDDWNGLVDKIYLGTLLYHFFLEREMTAYESDAAGIRIRYGKDVTVTIGDNTLKVVCGDVIVAQDDDRFIPRGAAICAYSRDGSERDWKLPARFRGRRLELFTLSKTGRGPAPPYRLEKAYIHLKLAPHVPVKLILSDIQAAFSP